ncbi:MAG: ATP-grasp domain-containing protein [Myxococcales bacterium]|nr:ATP-grasp domain-containing protein [Myxococcales bacterium]
MIRTLLVANRAEVASRVFRTARRLGIRTVAVHSEADADLPFVAEADLAVCIGPAPAAASYLDVEALLDAARRTGADAVHPGWGFLSERADFAEAVLAAGLTWVGPAPDVIRALGDKARARALAVSLGVNVVPGYHGADQDPAVFRAEAERIGLPVLLKAAAGGGGRGMRVVRDLDELVDAHASASREALAAFGDGTLLLEKLVERPRHIEVQVFGDGEGGVVHLFERECSIQRRHQKIVEEAPAPNLPEPLRAELLAAAVRLAGEVRYAGAGTVELIVGEDGSWAFLEMNTRLQVEHEVTEAITGVDLVAWQLAVAEGRGLPCGQDAIRAEGSAIQVRVYAEDPLRDWLPTHGTLVRLDLTGERVPTGFRAGDTVSVHYDSMLAKVIAVGPTRPDAVRQLARHLQAAWVPGLTTNLPLLREIAVHPAFAAGHTHTGFLGEHGLPTPPPVDVRLSILGAVLHLALDARARASFPRGVSAGFRVDGPAFDRDGVRVGESVVEVRWRWVGGALQARWEGGEADLVVLRSSGDAHRVVLDGVQQSWRIAASGSSVYVHSGAAEGFAVLEPRFPPPAPPVAEPGSCLAPTPGTVRAVRVAAGDTVEAGDVLVVVEAMKMEHAVKAPASGDVLEVRCAEGDAVDAGDLLVRMSTE